MPATRPAASWPPLQIWTFASGANAPGHIFGFARAGIPPGVSLKRMDRRGSDDPADWRWGWACADIEGAPRASWLCYRALFDAAQTLGSPVFVDTGAYSETKATPLRPGDWDDLVALQRQVADILGSQAFVVLPDKVGDQAATLRRLQRHRDEIRAMLAAGAHGIVVLQPGRRSAAEFAAAVADALGTRDLTLGFPVVGGRTSPEQIREALAELPWWPRGIHLLGIGPASPGWLRYMAALADVPPDVTLSADAVELRRLTGRERGVLTEEQARAAAAIHEEAWGAMYDPELAELVDPTEQLPDPSAWMTRKQATQIARASAGWLTPAEGLLLRSDPTAALRAVQSREGDGYAEAWLGQEIERAWRDSVERLSLQIRRRRALLAALGGERPVAPLVVPRVVIAQMELLAAPS